MIVRGMGDGAPQDLMIGGENDTAQAQIFAEAARRDAAARAAASEAADVKGAATWLFVALGVVLVGGALLSRH